MSKLVVIIFATCLFILFQQPDMSSASGEVRLCGRMLVEALSMLCEGRYNGPPGSSQIGKRDLTRMQPGSDAVPIWLLAMARMSELHHQQTLLSTRQQRGIVDECCRKPCNPSVLLSYCG